MHHYQLFAISHSGLTNAFTQQIKEFLIYHKFQIQKITDISDQAEKALLYSVSIDQEVDYSRLKPFLLDIARNNRKDVALIPNHLYEKEKKLIVFDMDSTLIQAEVIDELAKVHGIGDKVQEITERAMNGELNFDESFKERVSLLKGLSKTSLNEICGRLEFTEGTEKLMQIVRHHGIKTAIASGGFMYFAQDICRRLKMDYTLANELELSDDKVSGTVSKKIVNAAAKVAYLEELAQKENLTLDQTVAIGDGANDLPMLLKAGMGIAVHAKEKVKREANYHLSYNPMTGILYYLGINGNHFE